MMLRRESVTPAAALAILLTCAGPADAHQLDEYLQAVRIGIEPARIVVEMSLTPGAAVAKQVFSTLDRDGDGRLSRSESEAYGWSVLHDLALELDGRPYSLTLMRAGFPPWSEMSEGVGTIRLEAVTAVALSHGGHRLHFVNRHRPDIGVYLVNALMPATTSISIRAQHRDAQQHGIDLDFDRTNAYAGALWIVFPLAGLTALVLTCRRTGPRTQSERSVVAQAFTPAPRARS
jgi:hypothetical protein